MCTNSVERFMEKINQRKTKTRNEQLMNTQQSMVVVVEQNESLQEGFPNLLFVNARAREFFGLVTQPELLTHDLKQQQKDIVEREIVEQTIVRRRAQDSEEIVREGLYYYAYNLMDIFRSKLTNSYHEVYRICHNPEAEVPDRRVLQVQRLDNSDDDVNSQMLLFNDVTDLEMQSKLDKQKVKHECLKTLTQNVTQ